MEGGSELMRAEIRPAGPRALGFKAGLQLILFALLILLPGIQANFTDRDEGNYAQVCRTMYATGEWLVPRHFGEPWLDKPPLLYWLVTASFHVFGMGEWQARLVSVVASALSVLLTGMLGAAMFGRRVGIIAGLLLATCGLFAVVGRMFLMDPVLLTLILAAAWLHWRIGERSGQNSGFGDDEEAGERGGGREGVRGREGSEGISDSGFQISNAVCQASASAEGQFEEVGTEDRVSSTQVNALAAPGPQPQAHDPRSTIHDLPTQSAIRNPQSAIHGLSAAYWLLVGLGVLDKGPTIAVFVGGFALALTRLPGGWRRLGGWRWWVWMPLAGLVAVPWFVAMSRVAGGVMKDQFLLFGIISRVIGNPDGHGGPPGYHLAHSLATLLPWTVFVPTAILAAARERRGDPHLRLVLLWLIVPWIVVEVMRAKLPHYVLPCYVPLMILVARQWDAAISAGRWPSATWAERWVPAVWQWVMMLVSVAALLLWIAVGGLDRGWMLLLAALALAIGFNRAGRRLRAGAAYDALVAGLTTCVVAYSLTAYWLALDLAPLHFSRDLATTINAVAQPGDEVLLSNCGEPSAFYYIQAPARRIKPAEAEARLRDPRTPFVLAERIDDQDPLEGHMPPAAPPPFNKGGQGGVAERTDRALAAHPTSATVCPSCVVEGYNSVKFERVRILVRRITPPAEAAHE